MDIQTLFLEGAEFHGHLCPGLAIGIRAAVEAQKLLGAGNGADGEIICETENKSCGVDGIRFVLGCGTEKKSLIFRLTGEQAYTFYYHCGSEAVRLVLKDLPKLESREAKQSYILEAPLHEIFEIEYLIKR